MLPLQILKINMVALRTSVLKTASNDNFAHFKSDLSYKTGPCFCVSPRSCAKSETGPTRSCEETVNNSENRSILCLVSTKSSTSVIKVCSSAHTTMNFLKLWLFRYCCPCHEFIVGIHIAISPLKESDLNATTIFSLTCS